MMKVTCGPAAAISIAAAYEWLKGQPKNQVILVVKDKKGNIVSKISGPLKKGVSRVNWNLTSSIPTTIRATTRSSRGWRGSGGGIRTQVDPGM